MALQAILDSLDEVPEAFHELYKEQSGVFVLGVEGIDNHPTVKQLKAAHERQKKANTDLRTQLDELNGKVEAFGETTPEDIEELRKRLEEGGDKALTDEQINEMLEKRFSVTRNKMEKQIEALMAEHQSLTEREKALASELSEIKIFSEIDKHFIEAGGRKNALKDFRNRAREVWRMDDESGQPMAFNDGEPISGAHGPLSMAEWVDQQREEADYFFEANTGGGARGGDAGAGTGRVTIDLNQPNAIGRNLEAFAKGDVRVVNG